MIRVITLTRTNDGFPTQWEGATSDGRIVFIRYRHGELSIGVGETPAEAVDLDRRQAVGIIDGDGGVMTTDEMIARVERSEIATFEDCVFDDEY